MRRLMFGVAAGAILCLLGGVATIPPVGATHASQQPAEPSARILLDQYARGQHEEVVRAITVLVKQDAPGVLRPDERVSALGRDLDSVLTHWVDAGESTAREYRWLVGSSMALEGAGICMAIRPSQNACVDWLNVGLRTRATHPLRDFDRAWYLAAMSVVDGTRTPDVIQQFVKLAKETLYDQPEIDLELAFADELRWPDRRLSVGRSTAPKAVRPETPLLIRELPYRAPASLPRFSASSEEADLNVARRSFERSRKHEPVRAESTLRLGRVLARLRENDAALEHLGQVTQLTTDPELVHLSHLFRAEIHERTGRGAAAIDAYRAALSALPRARTAAMTLVPLLRDAGAVQEAASLTADLRTMNAIDDPWLRYTAGSLRQWHERIALVREALRKYKAPDSSYDGRTN